MSQFATGKHSKAICDRCGRKWNYLELKDQIFNEKKTGLMVCPECYDQDHPQLQLGRLKIYDPQALRNPRPDVEEEAVPEYNPRYIP